MQRGGWHALGGSRQPLLHVDRRLLGLAASCRHATNAPHQMRGASALHKPRWVHLILGPPDSHHELEVSVRSARIPNPTLNQNSEGHAEGICALAQDPHAQPAGGRRAQPSCGSRRRGPGLGCMQHRPSLQEQGAGITWGAGCAAALARAVKPQLPALLGGRVAVQEDRPLGGVLPLGWLRRVAGA